MSPPDIPDTVLQFIAERIDTVPQLEALLLMWEDPAKTWSEEEIAARIYQTRDAAVLTLQALQRRQLIRVDSHQPIRYIYNPSWDETGKVMAQVAASYRRHIVHVATLIHRGASSAVREFARAFDLKKDR